MLSFLHITIALLLSFTIALQQRGAGLSATFGGTGSVYVQRRGAERLLFQSTIALSGAFFVLGIVRMWAW